MKAFYWFLVRCFALYGAGALLFYFFEVSASNFIGSLQFCIFTGVVISLFTHNMTYGLRHHLTKASVLDKPNIRSMHTVPTPRGAGWAFVIPAAWFFTIKILANARNGSLWNTSDPTSCTRHELMPGQFEELCDIGTKSFIETALLVGLVLLIGFSWLDDRKGVRAIWRLLIQVFAVLLAYLALVFPNFDAINFKTLEMHFSYLPGIVPSWLAFLVLFIIFVGFLNIYNFMDGIDGITAIQTLTLSAGIMLANIVGLRSSLPIETSAYQLIPDREFFIMFVLFFCSIGFLFHNWHPAKIFLGDIGSVTIGYLMGFFLLVFISAGLWYVALTLPLYYLADGGITLARRILRGEKFWEAHRTHFYQRAAQAAGRHDVVVLKIAACNVVLIGIAMLELLVSPWFVLAAPLPVALLLHNMAHQRHIGVKSPNG